MLTHQTNIVNMESIIQAENIRVVLSQSWKLLQVFQERQQNIHITDLWAKTSSTASGLSD